MCLKETYHFILMGTHRTLSYLVCLWQMSYVRGCLHVRCLCVCVCVFFFFFFVCMFQGPTGQSGNPGSSGSQGDNVSDLH